MRNKSFLLVFAFAICLGVQAENPAFFSLLPSAKDVLPSPPAVGSYIWQADSAHYQQVKDVNQLTERGKNAKKDEPYEAWLGRYGADSVMNAPLGDTDTFPSLNQLHTICVSMKTYNTNLYRTRLRPYYYFGDKKKTASTKEDSYPSGHGYFAGLFGSIMLYMDPSNAPKIVAITNELTESRLILGAHWASDIEAGEKLGGMAFAIAMTDSAFSSLVKASRKELEDYRAYIASLPARIPDDKEAGEDLTTFQKRVKNNISAWKNDCDANPQKTMNIQVNRTFYCDGYYNTLCFPFDIPASEWNTPSNPLASGELKRFLSASVTDSTLSVHIEAADEIQAGVPYFIKFPKGEDIVDPIFSNVRIQVEDAGQLQSDAMNCDGIFAPFQIPQLGQDGGYLFLGADNTLYWPEVGDTSYLKGFRAYLSINKESSAPIRRGMAALLTEKGLPTHIHEVVWEENGATKAIENGQLVILHQGNTYSVQGLQIR